MLRRLSGHRGSTSAALRTKTLGPALVLALLGLAPPVEAHSRVDATFSEVGEVYELTYCAGNTNLLIYGNRRSRHGRLPRRMALCCRTPISSRFGCGFMADVVARVRAHEGCETKALLMQARPGKYPLQLRFFGAQEGAVALTPATFDVIGFEWYHCSLGVVPASAAGASANGEATGSLDIEAPAADLWREESDSTVDPTARSTAPEPQATRGQSDGSFGAARAGG